MQSDVKYAVIGLPCVVKGLRRAQRKMPRLRQNIPVVLGLVCGQQRSKWLAEYLVRRAGLQMQSVRRLSFREKREAQPASGSHFAVWTDENTTPISVERSNGYNLAWGQSYFKQDACNYCDDVFAELADAVFMDAWLPGFHEDPRGTTIALTRSALCRDVLETGTVEGGLQVKPIHVRDVIRSQEGCLRLKRDGTALQVSLSGDRGIEFHPRIGPAPKWRALARYRKSAENSRMAASRRALAAQRVAGPGLDTFNRTLHRLTWKDALALRPIMLFSLPKRAVKKAIRVTSSVLRRAPVRPA
jgi:hypothetical protein